MRRNVKIYEKIMDGYEFIEFMKSFNWKNEHGKYMTNYHSPEIGESLINKKNFQGWDYWFDRPYPEDVLREKRAITYLYYPQKQYCAIRVNTFLTKCGFKLLNDK